MAVMAWVTVTAGDFPIAAQAGVSHNLEPGACVRAETVGCQHAQRSDEGARQVSGQIQSLDRWSLGSRRLGWSNFPNRRLGTWGAVDSPLPTPKFRNFRQQTPTDDDTLFPFAELLGAGEQEHSGAFVLQRPSDPLLQPGGCT